MQPKLMTCYCRDVNIYMALAVKAVCRPGVILVLWYEWVDEYPASVAKCRLL